ncbi:S41 family peptidase [Tunturiibacter gelidoferens]|uniref:C-terminal processing protease CtpA/Prc n=1 Tax=Tunturiibacter lichenicola TaxID=2051959 RepID=A0A7Y9T525_9BACT|nr:S41 family peptidase [Edaphobacter lichenicola]NYF54102.1 C-terminal processing protease CtpA/Prc [Edaphobacter lichenicola]
MTTSPGQEMTLTNSAKREVLERVLKALTWKFYKPELLDATWRDAIESHRKGIEAAPTQDAFELAVTSLLQTLKTSHLGFFHGTAKRASSRAALSATYLADETANGSRWIFQDVHDGGSAALAGLQPGNILLRVDGKEIVPPEHPVFPMGASSTVDLIANDGQERTVSVEVAQPKGKKLQFVEPTLVQSKLLSEGIGYLKVAMFPGMIGVEVANSMSSAIAALGNISRLIIDLRGNTGGGVGALRLMSLITPNRVPVGFSPGKRWAKRDLAAEKTRFPRLGRIPSSKGALWLLGLQFLPALITKSPIVLETEGLGSKPYDGKIVLLVDRHTASAAEMVTIFAKENQLATIVGEKTAGRLLSATSVKVGHGFRLALPTGAYFTWNGTALEGSPIEPDVIADFDWQQRRSGVDAQLLKAINIAG